MYPLSVSARNRGSALIIVIPLVLLLVIALASLATYSRRARTDAGKQARQQTASAAIENRLGGMMSNGRTQMESSGVLNMSTWFSNSQESSAESTGGYLPTNATSTGGVTVVAPPSTAAMPNLAMDATTVLGTADDPFKGARAFTSPTTFNIEDVRDNSVIKLGDEGQNQLAGAVRWDVTANVRAIPMSQFTMFAGSSAAVNSASYPSGMGRTYVGGDLSVSGAVKTTYRMVIAGNASLASGSSIMAKADPLDANQTILTTSSTEPVWRDQTRPADAEGGIVTGADMPTRIAIPATMAQILAPPSSSMGQRSIYQLSTQAKRVVRLTAFDPSTGGTFVVTDAAGQPVLNSGPWRAGVDARNTNGGPTITFAYAEHYGAGTLQPSYYVMSDVPGTMLIVRQTRVLTGPLSVATPLPLAIINGLDDLAPGANPNDPAVHTALPRFANSLISGAGPVSVLQE